MARQAAYRTGMTTQESPLTQRPKAVLGGSATQIQGLAIVVARPVTSVGECGAPVVNSPLRFLGTKPVDPQVTLGIHMPIARPSLKGSQGRRIALARLVKEPAYFSVAILGDQVAAHTI
jgi:hypothetical protein